MCGITGVFAFNEVGRMNHIHLSAATRSLAKRGPDFQDIFQDYYVGLGHRRLSIIDTSEASNQPMQDEHQRYTLVFNGEIYNFQSIRQELQQLGYNFSTEGDTEVLLKAYMAWGKKCLTKLNGFFAFAIYDAQEGSLFVARDRIGIKPLLYYIDEDKFLFGSEMKAVLSYGIPRRLNHDAMRMYFELNYTPAPLTMIEGVQKLPPGHYLIITKNNIETQAYYELPVHDHITNYEAAQSALMERLHESVKMRMVADVPIGAFLSGGIDSSVITAIASEYTDHLNTFSIGFKDQPFFDETHYAELVAKKFNTNHTVFSLQTDDMLAAIDDIMDYIDDPFADSSAIPVYILSRETRKIATVALSGDGADELFAGYNKHSAWLRAMQGGSLMGVVKNLGPIWKTMPKSRSGKLSNLFRQLERLSTGLQLPLHERYWFWASISSTDTIENWLASALSYQQYDQIKKAYTTPMSGSMEDFLRSDVKLVLPNDMLTKVDLMSMANGLEVRVPFLDHNLVSFAFQLPDHFKIDGKMRKKILQDTFRSVLPGELYQRPKKGFEVPLLDWFRGGLSQKLDEVLFNHDFLIDQKIFDPHAIAKLKAKIKGRNPGDVHAQVWALFVFQSWYKKYFTS